MYILFLTVKFYYISRIKIYQFAPTVTFVNFSPTQKVSSYISLPVL